MLQKLVALGLVAGWLTVSGCAAATSPGSSQSPTMRADQVTSAAAAPTPAQDPLAQVVTATGALKTYSLKMTLTVPGESGSLKDSFVVDQSDPANVKYRGTADFGGRKINVIRIGDDMYYRVSAKQDWTKLAKAKVKEYDKLNGADLSGELAAIQAGASEVTTVGQETVDGVVATHYSVAVDAAKYSKHLGVSDYVVDDSFNYEVWADPTGRMIKFESTIKMKAMGSTQTYTTVGSMGSFDEPVSIKKP